MTESVPLSGEVMTALFRRMAQIVNGRFRDSDGSFRDFVLAYARSVTGGSPENDIWEPGVVFVAAMRGRVVVA
jgi:hypothetical protein